MRTRGYRVSRRTQADRMEGGSPGWVGWASAALLLAMASCSGSDTPVAPETPTTSGIELRKVSYDAGTATVNVEWDFFGPSPEGGFGVDRRVTGGSFEQVATVQTNLGIYRDTSPISGELLSYRVTALSTPPISTDSKAVSIPGAKMRNVEASPSEGTVEITWTADAEVAAASVVRTTEDGTEEVFELSDPGTLSFVDEGVDGNKRYTYFIRSTLTSGHVLSSAREEASLYLRTDWASAMPEAGGDSRNSIVGYVHPGISQAIVFLLGDRVGGQGTVGRWDGGLVGVASSRELSLTGLRTGSVSASQPIGDFRVSETNEIVAYPSFSGNRWFDTIRIHFLVAGINDNGEIEVRAHAFGIEPIWTRRWEENDATATVLVPLAGSSAYLLNTVRRLRILDASLNVLSEATFPWGNTVDLAVSSTVIWAVSEDGQVYYAAMEPGWMDTASFGWEVLETADETRVIAVAAGRSVQIYLLDIGASGPRVMLYRNDGEFLLSWMLEERPYEPSAMTVDKDGRVHVLSQDGRITAYTP